ncbi:MAG: hypothetical protein V1706_03710 [Pseudomonadota bacterium]
MRKKISSATFLALPILTLCMILAGCLQHPAGITIPENRTEKVRVKALHPPTEQILTCLENSSTLPPEELNTEFARTREDFIADRSDEKRIRLICMCLSRLDEPNSLEYAQELMKDMEHFNTTSYPDIRGLSALLHYFEHLQKKRVTEINRARHEVNELKKQLEHLKNIEEIISERNNGN